MPTKQELQAELDTLNKEIGDMGLYYNSPEYAALSPEDQQAHQVKDRNANNRARDLRQQIKQARD